MELRFTVLTRTTATKEFEEMLFKRKELARAMDYLETGGLGEVIGLTQMALDMNEPKVQMDTDMAMALCLLASEAIKQRTDRSLLQ